jgi:tetratricopeptide (TPR) repeat protein
MSRIASKAEKKSIENLSNTRIYTATGLVVILLLTFFVYQSVTGFDSTNWDDKAYLKEAPYIRDINFEKTKKIFTEKFMLSYNPIVMLTFAFDSEMSGLKPGWSHGVNLFFHLLNVLLLFFCLKQLKFKDVASLIITLLFAIHPLATEAVVWIAGRKDVVYLFFFLLSWLSYLKYYHTEKKIYLIISLLFGAISLLSKVQAITLPFVLIISDLMLDKKIEVKRLVNKIPYLILTLLIGVIAISGEGDLVADKYSIPLSVLDKLLYSTIAFGLYIIKIIVPVNQIAIHQFPLSGSSDYIAGLVIGIVALATVLSAIFFSYKKNPRLAGSILFFAVCIFPVLHIVAVNSALIYERFTYLAAVGIFMAIFSLLENKPALEKKISIVMVAVGVIFTGLTYARIPVWKNSISLWTDMIEKDHTVPTAYMNRGQYFESRGEIDKAFSDFTEVIKLAPHRPDGYHNRAVIFYQRNDLANALLDNEKALLNDPENSDALVNRGDLYFNLNKNDSAIFYYKKAISIKPDHAKAYYDCAAAYFKLSDFQNAIYYYKKSIEIIPDYHDAFVYMAVSYASLDSIPQAKFALDKADKLVPNSAGRTLVSSQLVKLGNAAFAKNQVDESLRFYTTAIEINPANAEAYYNLGGIYFYRRNNQFARENWQKALTIKPDYADAQMWLNRIGGN